jgi:hypothetical protein
MNAAASAKCITEEILAHVGDENDEITSGTLIRVIQVWFGLENYHYNGVMTAALSSKSNRFEFENFQK